MKAWHVVAGVGALVTAAVVAVKLRPAAPAADETLPGTEGGSAPPPKRKRPGKDSVFKGGLRGSGPGEPPPPKPGGFTVPGGAPEPEPEPGGGGGGGGPTQPGGAPQGGGEPPAPAGAVGDAQSLPDPKTWRQLLPAVGGGPIPVLVADDLPDGTFFVRMTFMAKITTRRLIHHGGNTYSWSVSEDRTYGQRVRIAYEIKISGEQGILRELGRNVVNVDTPLVPRIFGCNSKQECGWNGTYTDYFEPRLSWNPEERDLVMRFRTLPVINNKDNNEVDVSALIEFSGIELKAG